MHASIDRPTLQPFRKPCPISLCLEVSKPDWIAAARLQVFPGRSEETYDVPLTRTVYIEASDFRESDVKGYYGLAPGKTAMLKCAYFGLL